jgi:hypothetical protein
MDVALEPGAGGDSASLATVMTGASTSNLSVGRRLDDLDAAIEAGEWDAVAQMAPVMNDSPASTVNYKKVFGPAGRRHCGLECPSVSLASRSGRPPILSQSWIPFFIRKKLSRQAKSVPPKWGTDYTASTIP